MTSSAALLAIGIAYVALCALAGPKRLAKGHRHKRGH